MIVFLVKSVYNENTSTKALLLSDTYDKEIEMTVIVTYGILFIITVINLWIAVSYRYRQSNSYYSLLFFIMAISSYGYLALATSQSLETAMLANKICYLGGCFLMSTILLCVLDLCNIKISTIVRVLINSLTILVYGIILTTGYFPLYYASEEISFTGGFTHIEIAPGPLHFLFTVLMITYNAAIIGVILYAFKNKRSVSYKNLIYILCMDAATVSMYFIKKSIGFEFNLLPVAYAIDGIILLALMRRIGLYDVSATVAKSLYNQDLYGYITFDRKKAFLACDSTAKRFFPELGTLYVDHVLPEDNDFFKRLSLWMDELSPTYDRITYYEKIGDREVKCTTSYIYQTDSSKPRTVGYMIEIFDVTDERKYLNLMTKYNEELKRNVEAETKHVKEVQDKMILGMANMIENRDNNTGGHIKRTSKCIAIIAEELRRRDDKDIYTKEFCNALIKAAPMHDIGKIAVDDVILRKPSKFTPEEFEKMKQHAPQGANLLNTIIENVEEEYFVRIAENMAHFHHERWNGTGYPNNLQGEEIPLEARIMAIADVYDALVSKRCYKDRMSFEEAANIIREGMGTQFDPSLADVFESCREALEAYYLSEENQA